MDFHGSSDALFAAHYAGYGVWMEEVYNFMNQFVALQVAPLIQDPNQIQDYPTEHDSSDALLAAHYTGYGVWMEEVYNFMNQFVELQVVPMAQDQGPQLDSELQSTKIFFGGP